MHHPRGAFVVEGGESTWEKVSSIVDSGEEGPSPKDEYAALTAQLAASGPAAGTRAKTRRPAPAVSIMAIALTVYCLSLMSLTPLPAFPLLPWWEAVSV